MKYNLPIPAKSVNSSQINFKKSLLNWEKQILSHTFYQLKSVSVLKHTKHLFNLLLIYYYNYTLNKTNFNINHARL